MKEKEEDLATKDHEKEKSRKRWTSDEGFSSTFTHEDLESADGECKKRDTKSMLTNISVDQNQVEHQWESSKGKRQRNVPSAFCRAGELYPAWLGRSSLSQEEIEPKQWWAPPDVEDWRPEGKRRSRHQRKQDEKSEKKRRSIQRHEFEARKFWKGYCLILLTLGLWEDWSAFYIFLWQNKIQARLSTLVGLFSVLSTMTRLASNFFPTCSQSSDLLTRSCIEYCLGKASLALAVLTSNWGMMAMTLISFAQPNLI